MAKSSYIYFGDYLFDKFHKIVDDDYNSWFLSKSVKFKIFTSLDIANSNIDKIFLGWSYVVLQIGDKFYHVGFPNLKGESSRVFESDNSKDLTITCGANEVYAATSNGKFYTYSTQSLQPALYDLTNQELKIRKVITGDFLTIALMHDGAVLLVNLEEKPELKCLPFPCPIAQVSCGKEHAVFLSHSGQVFSFGNGSRGQLGHGTIENYSKPTLLEALDGVQMVAIACGGWHSAAISAAGDLYIWGWNESGQLGFPCSELHGDTLPVSEIETVCCLPKIVEFGDDKQIESVSCGTRHTAVLTKDSEVWTWGWNEYGQLGHDSKSICDKPSKILFTSEFVPKKIDCAFWSTLIWGTLTS